MTYVERYRFMTWLRERGGPIAVALLLVWAAGVVWKVRTEGLATPGEDEAEPVAPAAAPSGGSSAAVSARREEVRWSPAKVNEPAGEWKMSLRLAAAIQRAPAADHHAVAVFQEGVKYRRALEVVATTDLIITGTDYQGSYRIGVVGSGRALESLAAFPEIFRLDAR